LEEFYQRLQKLLGSSSYERVRSSHKAWVEEYLAGGVKNRQEKWTGSNAVGSKPFVERVRARLVFRAKGRGGLASCEGYQLRGSSAHYKALLEAEKDDIGPKNTFFWDLNAG